MTGQGGNDNTTKASRKKIRVRVPWLAAAPMSVAGVERSQVAPMFDRVLTARTGRPKKYDTQMVLRMAATYSIAEPHDMHLLAMVDAINEHPEVWAVLGLPEEGEVPYDAVWRTFNDMRHACVPAGSPKRVKDFVTGELYDWPDYIGISFDEVLTRIVNAACPPQIEPSPRQALDATHLEAWGRRKAWSSKERPNTVYPHRGLDGRLVKGSDEDSRESAATAPNNRKDPYLFVGWQPTVMVDTVMAPNGHVMHLPRALAFPPAGASPADTARHLVGTFKNVVSPALAEILIDRGYSQSAAEDLHLPLRKAGVEVVFTLKKDQHVTHPGPEGTHTVFINGGLFTDAVPKKFWHLPLLTRPENETHDDKQARLKLEAEYDRLERYSFARYRSDGDPLVEHLMGPARRGTVRCVNYPPSMLLPADSHHPTTDCVEGVPCGCARFVTLGPEPEHHPRDRRKYVYGSKKWRRAYGQRNQVESFFADAKLHLGDFNREAFRVRGTEGHGLLAAIYLAGVAVRIAWRETVCDPVVPEELRPVPPPVPIKRRQPHNTARAAVEARIAAC